MTREFQLVEIVQRDDSFRLGQDAEYCTERNNPN